MKKIEYLIGEDVTVVIKSALYDFYKGTVDFTGPDLSMHVIVRTGLAGLYQIDKDVKKMAKDSGLEIVTEVGDRDTSPYTSYVIPFLANVKFVVDTLFDPMVPEDENENPFIQGFRRSSYNYTISEEGKEPVIEVVATGVKDKQL